MNKSILGLLVMLAGPVGAEEWRQLTAAQITSALAARVVVYAPGTTLNFFVDGRTLYKAGAGESWGKWRVEGAHYCSVWPPSERWACYGVEAEAGGLDLRFLAEDGAVTAGPYQDQP